MGNNEKKKKIADLTVNEFCEILEQEKTGKALWKKIENELIVKHNIHNTNSDNEKQYIKKMVICPFICIYVYQEYLLNLIDADDKEDDGDRKTCMERWDKRMGEIIGCTVETKEINQVTKVRVKGEEEKEGGYQLITPDQIFGTLLMIEEKQAFSRTCKNNNLQKARRFTSLTMEQARGEIKNKLDKKLKEEGKSLFILERKLYEDEAEGAEAYLYHIFQDIEVPVFKMNENPALLIEQHIIQNQQVIFTGAPGTGKTYNVLSCVRRLCKAGVKTDEENDENTGKECEPRYQFVQFHPSYDYSDFVEGLRPVMLNGGGKNKNRKENGQAFVRVDGIFKKFCRRIVEENLERAMEYILKLPPDSEEEDALKYRRICCPEVVKAEEKQNVHVMNRTGKENDANGQIEKIRRDLTERMYANILREEEGSYSVAENLFCWGNEAGCRNDRDGSMYYFIIDEINRADLSKVFGELMFGLEESYRGIENRFPTQYSYLPTYKAVMKEDDVTAEPLTFDCFQAGFFIPHNLCIIGTMNDIDRSVETFDFAMRRRFRWIDIKANEIMESTLTSMWQRTSGLDMAEEHAKNVAGKIKKMNDVLTSPDNKTGLTEAYHIGPAYFKDYTCGPDGGDNNLKEIFEQKIEPLIREYVRGQRNVEGLIEDCRNALLLESGNPEDKGE